jgi:hypothetical protein
VHAAARTSRRENCTPMIHPLGKRRYWERL